jgi:dTDP-4-dehydrorhamnose 3,5-epimerase
MKFSATNLRGAYIVDLEPKVDDRGFFVRTFCQREFAQYQLNDNFVQCNLSSNDKRATLRGMHYQMLPHQEVKLVWCTLGAISDVIVDLRAESPTFRHWIAVELNSTHRRMLYVPKGCAHGYITLTDHAEVAYQVSEYYAPESERGVRWDDPAFGIRWPIQPMVISDKDRSHPDFIP